MSLRIQQVGVAVQVFREAHITNFGRLPTIPNMVFRSFSQFNARLLPLNTPWAAIPNSYIIIQAGSSSHSVPHTFCSLNVPR